ncbi:pericentriolar material 1 protein isoform X1 [Cyprinodon tularosa]|uniref:pericentriolar material 1 protein isoform X1 n=1 Tax=Cyprinodon tularosa TaxID=77115 RepID=UPI0018E1FDEB|nr:pericentriolar material 1 protein isoform X1 [Cyprinodon tularosa]XP_038127797.1 pericentriolar material 1 protein isoform X1 [Cyprinodon tularosa]XP_038127798.1 pericentriolar material 1 protein isoform X1 [Cyprinodon tularosa]
MATGGAPFDDGAEELHNWTAPNGSLEDRLNNMNWGIQQKKANRSSEKNKKKLSASVVESRLTNDISPESTPGVGRKRARTPQSYPHIKYTTQMSVPDQAELDKLRQRINFTDLDERSIGSDSQGRVTAANNQRQMAGENKKPYNYLPLHVNTNKSKQLLHPSASAPTTPATSKEMKKQSPGRRETSSSAVPHKESSRMSHGGPERELLMEREYERQEPRVDSSQVVSKLVQIRDYISKVSAMRDDLVEKNDVPANVERLSYLIDNLKEQEKSYLRFLQKVLAHENDCDLGTLDSAVGSGSLAESSSLNIEVQSSDASNTAGGRTEAVGADQKEELENLRKQHELLKKMLEQQEQLRALQGRQEALMAMQQSAEHALAVIEDTVVTETTGSVSGLSITSELNEELNDLIQRFHNQLHESQTKMVPDNRRQAQSLSLSGEVSLSWSRPLPPQHRPLLHSASGPHAGLDTSEVTASAKLTKLQELQDKKQTMDKILQELHSLRDQTLNNNSCRGLSAQFNPNRGLSADHPSAFCSNTASTSSSFQPLFSQQESSGSSDKLRKLKEVHKRLNELRELVQYYEQTSDMMVDAVNENVKEADDDDEEEDETEDGSMFETVFELEHENHQPVANIRNQQRSGNWADLNSLTNGRSVRSGSTNNQDGRLNTECEINNRAAANLRSLKVTTPIECQYNRDLPYDQVKDENDDEDGLDNNEGAHAMLPDSVSESSRGSSFGSGAGFPAKVHRQTAKQKLRQLQELVAMVQSDDTDGTTANDDEALHQQPNNTRAPVCGASKGGSKQGPGDIALTSKAREKLYEEKLRQQKQELRQLHEERQRLIEIQGKIQDLQWTCPDHLSSVSSTASQQGLLRKAPVAVSTPANVKPSSSGPKTNLAMLKPTAPEAASSSVTDNELWSEMRRGQILREDLRQRRKHLESLMAEHQRRSGPCDSPCPMEDQEGSATLSHSINRDERTMATWGSSPCNLDDDDEEEEDYRSEICADEEEEQEECTESGSEDDIHVYSQRAFIKRKNQGSNLKPPAGFSGDVEGHLHNETKVKQQTSSFNQSSSQSGGIRRQENLRWASELSFAEGTSHWQEQINQLQRQLDFSTSMCQTLLQDQQTLSYMLQTLLTGQYNTLPNNVSSPQVQLVMHQLNQCYTQLAWQQNNVQRLKQVLNDLIRQQASSSSAAGWQTQKQSSARESSPGPSASPGFFLPFSSAMNPSTVNMANPSLSPFSPSFNLYPTFPGAMSDLPLGAEGTASSEHQKRDQNTSMKTEYMGFPPPLHRSPLNTATERRSGTQLNTSYTNNITQHSLSKTELQESPSSSPTFNKYQSRPQEFDKASQESFCSIPDPVDPATVTKTFKAGKKASAQANLASWSKTPKNRRSRKSKGHKNSEGHDSDSYSSTAESVQERAASSHHKDQNQALLDKLTQEKLDSKTKVGSKRNDLSSAYAWRTPFLSNRIACTEAPDASSDFSLFEALRETIYSEVATLISQNESRPHFLIELFHELQLLNTDYLRQRALYSLQDIVTKHLAVRRAAEDQLPPLGSVVWTAGSQSELTPSQSLITSDEEVLEKNLRHAQDLKRREDAESVDNDSNMSTSSNLEPFANDDLGNTVIHLDKALARIREYERMKLKAEFNPCNASTAGANRSELTNANGASSNPAEPVEESAANGVHCPQIDTQQLDRQIKAIMTEVIPFLKENMNEVCSHQLLTSVRRMVLTLTQQNDESKEFVRFFHKQLGGILQESLSKFVGRTLKDCGEDLLVEISEILFNELAFFKLMQDLDSSNSTTNLGAKYKNKRKVSQIRKTRDQEQNTEAGAAKSVSPAFADEDKDQDETEKEGSASLQETYLQREVRSNRGSETSEGEEDEGCIKGVPLSISLSKAESQALTNYGSGEDENDEEEMEEFEAGPVDVQTSLQVLANGCAEQEISAMATTSCEAQKTNPEQNSSENNEISNSAETSDPSDGEHTLVEQQEVGASAAEGNSEISQDVPKEPSSSSSPNTDSPVLVNVDEIGSGNTSQKSDEEDFVKVDDLPLQLTVMCEEELQKRIVEEQHNNNLSVEILNSNTELLTGLVGNAQELKEPETADAQNV